MICLTIGSGTGSTCVCNIMGLGIPAFTHFSWPPRPRVIFCFVSPYWTNTFRTSRNETFDNLNVFTCYAKSGTCKSCGWEVTAYLPSISKSILSWFIKWLICGAKTFFGLISQPSSSSTEFKVLFSSVYLKNSSNWISKASFAFFSVFP